MAVPLFSDRIDAGRQLAARLQSLRGTNPLILALPRGGVPVAHAISDALGAQMDLLMVRKIGVPWQPELALAAVVDGEHPEVVLNEEVARLVEPEPEYLRSQTARELEEIERQRNRYLGGRQPIPVDGRVAVVVDDGIATGATVRAALRGLRRHRPGRLIVATPVAPPDTLERLRSEADEVVCIAAPEDFIAVGAYYHDFHPTSDEEVINIMGAHRGEGRVSRPVTRDEVIVDEVRRSLIADQRIDIAHHPISMIYDDGLLVLLGEVGSVAAKHLAVAAARRHPEVKDVEDRLTVSPVRPLSDPQVKDSVRAALFADQRFKDSSIYVIDQGRRISIREVPEPGSEIEIADVDDGIVTLKGRTKDILTRQMAGVVAWHAEGVRGVVNQLVAENAGDREPELDQAVRLALDADTEIRGAGISATAREGVVTLEGRVHTPDVCLRAESDVWMVDGVREVVNHIAVG